MCTSPPSALICVCANGWCTRYVTCDTRHGTKLRIGGRAEDLTMPDTTEPAAIITRLIATGVPEPALLAMVARQFPELTWRDLSQALQVAQARAERRLGRG